MAVDDLGRSPAEGSKCEMTSPNLGLTIQRVGDRVVVHVRGELDLQTDPIPCGCLAGLVRSGARDIVVDMAGVSFLGVQAVDVMLDARQRFAERGGRLTLSSPSRMALRLLGLIGAADLLGTDEVP